MALVYWDFALLLFLVSCRKAKQAYMVSVSMSLDVGFAVVKLATDRSTGEEYAVKIMALPEANAKAGDNENTRCKPYQPLRVLCHLRYGQLHNVDQLHLQCSILLRSV